jgi:hypothetical protein
MLCTGRQVTVHSSASFARKFGKTVADLASEQKCSICIEEFESGVYVSGKCGHGMHLACAVEWMKTCFSARSRAAEHGTEDPCPHCPMCRRTLISYRGLTGRSAVAAAATATEFGSTENKLQVIDTRAEDCSVACMFTDTDEIEYLSHADYLRLFSPTARISAIQRPHAAFRCTRFGQIENPDTRVTCSIMYKTRNSLDGATRFTLAKARLIAVPRETQHTQGIKLYAPCYSMQQYASLSAKVDLFYKDSRIDIVLQDAIDLLAHAEGPARKIVVIDRAFKTTTPVSTWSYAMHRLAAVQGAMCVSDDRKCGTVDPVGRIKPADAHGSTPANPLQYAPHLSLAFRKFATDPSTRLMFLSLSDTIDYTRYDLSMATDVFFVSPFGVYRYMPMFLSYASESALRAPVVFHWYIMDKTNERKTLAETVQIPAQLENADAVHA